jgi:hypothetical protein
MESATCPIMLHKTQWVWRLANLSGTLCPVLVSGAHFISGLDRKAHH